MTDAPLPPEGSPPPPNDGVSASDAAGQRRSDLASTVPPSLGERAGGAHAAVTDGLQTLGRLLAGAGWAARGILLAVSLFGVTALAVGLATWHATLLQDVIVVVLVAPCIVAPQVLRRRIGDLVETATHPAEAAAQARDLLSRVKPGGEMHREVNRLRSVVADADRRRIRQTIEVARATGGVLAMVEPDPERHRLLLPLRPERLAYLSAWASASLWGPLLAGIVIAAALVTLVVRLVS